MGACAGCAEPLGGWRVVVACAAAVALSAIVLLGAGRLRTDGSVAAPRPAPAGFASLPSAARGPVSAALGRDDRAYWVHGSTALNPAQHLRVAFSPAGVRVISARGFASFSLAAVGRANALQSTAPVAPRARTDRVTYVRPGLREWYANGPLGLEQGFTVARSPRGRGSLDLVMTLTGDLRARMAAGSVLLGTSLRYTGLAATDATGRRLPARIVLHGRRLILAVDDHGARFPVKVDPFVQQAELTASDGVPNTALGSSVAISGNTIVVGAQSLMTTPSGPGALYVFTEPAAGWANATQIAKLTASDGAAGDELGHSVALSGDTIVAGAPEHSVAGAAGQGAAYVFQRPASGWVNATQTAELAASDGVANDLFGSSVAIAGATAVVSSPGHAVGATLNDGSVYVFQRPATGWTNGTQTGELQASDGTGNLSLGTAVSISADASTIAAGASGYGGNTGPTPYTGAVYVFVRPAGGWASGMQTAELSAVSDAGASASLGSTVAISADGDTIVAGAPGYSTVATMTQGAVFVFVKAGSVWGSTTNETAQLTASDAVFGGGLGDAVAITGSTVYGLAVGGTAEHLYAYTEPPTGWATTAEPATTVSPAQSADGTRFPIAASGATLVVGAPANTVGSSTDEGAAYVLGAPGTFATPTVSAVSPSSGPTAGGTAVTITGSNLSGAVAVTFGGVPAASFTVVSSSEIAATSPPGTSGAVDVVVTTNDGSSPTGTADAFTYGTGTGAGGGTGAGRTTGPPAVPADTGRPAITGTAQAGKTLTCSSGTWTNTPTGYAYQWSRDGTPILGAQGRTYIVQKSDEELTLTCAVAASNAKGAGVPASSAGLPIPVPVVRGCPKATGRLSGSTLGRVKIGDSRAQALHAYRFSTNRGKKYQDFFCLTPIGIRVSFASPALSKKLRDRVIWVSTSNAYYTLKGLRVGATVAAAAKKTKLAGPYKVGRNSWYLTPNGAANGTFKVQRGVIQEIGVADKSLTKTAAARRKFFRSLR